VPERTHWAQAKRRFAGEGKYSMVHLIRGYLVPPS